MKTLNTILAAALCGVLLLGSLGATRDIRDSAKRLQFPVTNASTPVVFCGETGAATDAF